MKSPIKYAVSVIVLAAGCGDPIVKMETKPRVHPVCEAFCKKIEDVCGFGPPGSATDWQDVWEDCPRDCTAARPEDDPCRVEHDAATECVTAQSCDYLRPEFGDGRPLPLDADEACYDERVASHLCNLENAPPSEG